MALVVEEEGEGVEVVCLRGGGIVVWTWVWGLSWTEKGVESGAD